MGASEVGVVILLHFGEILHGFLHVLDDEAVVVDDACLLGRDGEVVFAFHLLVLDEGHALVLGAVAVGYIVVCEGTEEVGLAEAAGLHCGEFAFGLAVEQGGDDPVDAGHGVVELCKGIAQGALIAGIGKLCERLVATGTSPDDILAAALFPEEFASEDVFLMQTGIEGIDGIDGLLVVAEIVVGSGLTFGLYIQEIGARGKGHQTGQRKN